MELGESEGDEELGRVDVVPPLKSACEVGETDCEDGDEDETDWDERWSGKVWWVAGLAGNHRVADQGSGGGGVILAESATHR